MRDEHPPHAAGNTKVIVNKPSSGRGEEEGKEKKRQHYIVSCERLFDVGERRHHSRTDLPKAGTRDRREGHGLFWEGSHWCSVVNAPSMCVSW